MRVPNEYRIRTGILASDDSIGNNGLFLVPFRSFEFTCVASDGLGWEHVSVTLKNRCPNWEEMCFMKNLFWGEEETVIQFHPPKSEYINNHDYCLHLWKPIGKEIPLPDSRLIGIKDLNI